MVRASDMAWSRGSQSHQLPLCFSTMLLALPFYTHEPIIRLSPPYPLADQPFCLCLSNWKIFMEPALYQALKCAWGIDWWARSFLAFIELMIKWERWKVGCISPQMVICKPGIPVEKRDSGRGRGEMSVTVLFVDNRIRPQRFSLLSALCVSLWNLPAAAQMKSSRRQMST